MSSGTWVRLVAVAATLICAQRALAALSVGFPLVADAAQDGYGLVWAASKDGKLAVHEGGSWHSVGLPDELKGAKFFAMHAAADGQVLMLWEKEPGKVILTQTKGAKPKPSATLDATLREPTMFSDSRGDVWIASQQHIYRFPAGKTQGELAYTIPGEFFDRVVTGKYAVSPLRAFEDGRKRIWFWSESRYRGGEASLRGALVHEAGKWETAVLDTLPGSRFATMEKKDGDHAWVAIHRESLFVLDLTTRQAERVEEPEPGAFRDTRGIRRAGESTLVIVESIVEDNLETVLWQERGGNWTKLATRLDREPPYEMEPQRGFLETPAGMLLGGFGTGMWLLRGDEAVQLDWRARVRIATVNRLFHLRRDQYVAVSFHGGGSFIGRAKEPPLPDSNARAAVFALSPPVQDARKHLWSVGRDSRSLAEWNGSEWKFHRKPAELTYLQRALGVDTDQRIWIFNAKPTIFDPATGQWEVFPDFRAAIQAQAGSSRRFPGFKHRPFLSRDGRAVFSDFAAGTIDYFDGSTWQQWRRGETGDLHGSLGAVFFADDTVLTRVTGENVWQFTEGQGWAPAAAAVRVPEEASHLPKKSELPADIKRLEPERAVCDESGIWWFTRDRALYKAAFGRSTSVFDEREPHPFLDGRVLSDRHPVLTDARGNAVLVAGDTIIVPPRSAPPDTGARLAELRGGSARIELSSTSGDAAWWRWRTDGEAWSSPTRERMLTVEFDQNGLHAVEVAAIDSDLQSDPTPARLEVNVEVDWERVFAGETERLRTGSEEERAAAIAALARNPGAALPVLRIALEGAGDRERWWLEAAIQEIERRVSASTQSTR